MTNSVFIALSKRRGLEQQLNIVANNLANLNTPSFKAEKLIFREFLIDPQDRAPALSYTQDVGTARNLADGPIKTTGNPFDVAITGPGYFVVETPQGERYTRHGRFQLDANGVLVNNEGHAVQSDGGPLTIPQDQTDITIATDGTVSTEDGVIGALRLVEFENPQEMRRAANGLYSALQPPTDVAEPKMVQGGLEQSNVVAVEELTEMIRISRAHASSKRFMDQEDRRVREMIDKIGRPI